MEALVKIPGVGRKTANVILGHIFGKPGFVVDTHVRRLTYRLGFTKNTEPEKIEIDMQKILPAEDWTPVSMRLILHGRQICDRAQAAVRDLRDRRGLPADRRGQARQAIPVSSSDGQRLVRWVVWCGATPARLEIVH